MILLDQPAIYGLPANPEITLPLAAWQKVVQPASVGLTLTAVAATGLSFIIARRQHLREKAAQRNDEEAFDATSLPAEEEKKDNG